MVIFTAFTAFQPVALNQPPKSSDETTGKKECYFWTWDIPHIPKRSQVFSWEQDDQPRDTDGHRFTGRLASVLGLDKSGNPAEFGATAEISWSSVCFGNLLNLLCELIHTYRHPILNMAQIREHLEEAGRFCCEIWVDMGRFRGDFSIIQFPSLICVPLRLSQDTKQMYTVYYKNVCILFHVHSHVSICFQLCSYAITYIHICCSLFLLILIYI